MKQSDITMVRVYCSQGHQHQKIIDLLHREHRVTGDRFGHPLGLADRYLHDAGLLDVSLDLPVVVEFFDASRRRWLVLPLINDIVDRDTSYPWPANVNMD